MGNENTFTLDDSFNDKSFTFWGINEITSFWNFYQYLFISEKGSKIFFYYMKYGEEGEKLNPIYPNSKTDKTLSDCHKI